VEVEVDVIVDMEEGDVPNSSLQADGCTKIRLVPPKNSLDDRLIT
jgi:hypothetical protein